MSPRSKTANELRITSYNSGGDVDLEGLPSPHLDLAPLNIVRAYRLRFACRCLGIFGLVVTGAGCSMSPRSEYMQTRAIEVAPTNEGDGTTLAQRDQIMRGAVAGVFTQPSAPLAAVKSDSDDNRQ